MTPFPLSRVPDLDFTSSLVAAGRDQALAVEAERDAPHIACVAGQRSSLLPSLGVPNLHGRITAPRNKIVPLRTERHAIHAIAMRRKSLDRLSGDDIPHSDSPINS